jgi:heme oxygenase (biliverdin-IX-beta and delta-forming)
MSELLNSLRERTRTLHSRLDTVIPVLRPGFSREEYAQVLEQFHGYHAGVQAMLCAYQDMPAPFVDLMDDRRVKWLKADLTYLGYSQNAIAQLPVCSELPELRTPASLLGAAYVFEGSTLGSQIISRHLKSLWGFQHHAGAAFFTAYGAETGRRWTAFTHFLCAEGDSFSQDSIVDSAVSVFQSVWTWFSTEAARASKLQTRPPALVNERRSLPRPQGPRQHPVSRPGGTESQPS